MQPLNPGQDDLLQQDGPCPLLALRPRDGSDERIRLLVIWTDHQIALIFSNQFDRQRSQSLSSHRKLVRPDDCEDRRSGARPRKLSRACCHFEDGGQAICWTESIGIGLCKHVTQSLGRRGQKPGSIRNHCRLDTGLSDGIECLYEGHVALPSKRNAFGWLHVVCGDTREGRVMRDGRALRESQFIEM